MEVDLCLKVLRVVQMLCVSFLVYVSVTSYWVLSVLILLVSVHTLKGVVRRKYGGRITGTGRGVYITGCDTGFGHDVAVRLYESGFTVFAGCLQPTGEGANKLRACRSDRLHVVPLDVTDDDSVEQAGVYVRKHLPKHGLWAVINNAGFCVMGDVEWFTVEQYRRAMEVNLFGAVRTIRSFLPLVRKCKGRVVIVSSVRGRFSFPGFSGYHVTKHGLETMADSLRLEMYKFGVDVSLIEPGNFSGATQSGSPEKQKRWHSEMEESWRCGTEDARRDYGKQYLEGRLAEETGEMKGSAATTKPVVDAMEDAVMSCHPLTRYLVSGGEGFFAVDYNIVLARYYGCLPTWLSDWIVIKITGCNKFPKGCQQKRD